jgi:two-component system, NtrC family, sensor histidine kinase PilS
MTTLSLARPWGQVLGHAAEPVSIDPPHPRGLLWLAGLRTVIALGLLAPIAAFAAGQGEMGRAMWFGGLLALPLLSTGVTLAGGNHLPGWVLRAQLALDAGIVLLIVWSTGGLVSQYAPLLILPALAASALLGRGAGLRVAMVLALGVTLLYAVHHAWFHVPVWLAAPLFAVEHVSGSFAAYALAIQVLGVVAVSLLVGQLAESLSRTGADLARANSSLADLTSLSQRVLDSMAGGVVAADATGRVVLFNRTAAAITGLAAEDAMGRRLAELLQLPSGWQVGLSQGLPGRFEFRFTRDDGQALELGCTVAPLVDDRGQVAGELLTFQDLTDIKQHERERQRQARLAAVGEMAAGIAHEIRNPLASMSGSIQLLHRELVLTEEQGVLLGIVLRESQRLNDIIKDFLSYAGPQRVTRSAIDVRPLLKETAALLTKGGTMGRTHRVDVDVPAQPVVHDVDEGQLRQVIWNLSTNALKAMPSGGHLRLAVAHRPTPGRREPTLELTVTDDGVGMPRDAVERMFQPFQGGFRQGSGLGLSIVHRIVADHGGTIRVDSTPGGGTAVVIAIPWPPLVEVPGRPAARDVVTTATPAAVPADQRSCTPA